MRNESHHQQLYYQHKKNMFLPILCSRPTIKDVTLPRSNRPSNSSCNDPLSPRIGCMGQVKRNNKIAGFPTSSHTNYNRLITFSNNKTTPPTTISPLVKYSKLKSLFSSKNLTNTTTPSTTKSTTTTTFSSCRTKQRVSKNQRCRNRNKNENVVAINIDVMDPPLPVIKKVVKLEEGESLWKRRSGGPTIKSLQLQQIQHLNLSPQPTTV